MTFERTIRAPRHRFSTANELFKIALISFELIGYRFRRSNIGTFLAIGEPVAVVALFTFIQQMVIKKPPFGSSTALFYTTGIMPFYLFFHMTIRFRQWDLAPRYPGINEITMFLSQLCSELISKIMIIAIVCSALYWDDTPDAVPNSPYVCFFALLILAVMGAAVGFINIAISLVFPPWTYIYQVAMRGWMAFSGILTVVDTMPVPMREAATWVPVTHAVTLYRTGQYLLFPHSTLDMGYLLKCTAGVVVLSLLIENGTRRWRNFR